MAILSETSLESGAVVGTEEDKGYEVAVFDHLEALPFILQTLSPISCLTKLRLNSFILNPLELGSFSLHSCPLLTPSAVPE